MNSLFQGVYVHINNEHSLSRYISWSGYISRRGQLLQVKYLCAGQSRNNTIHESRYWCIKYTWPFTCMHLQYREPNRWLNSIIKIMLKSLLIKFYGKLKKMMRKWTCIFSFALQYYLRSYYWRNYPCWVINSLSIYFAI